MNTDYIREERWWDAKAPKEDTDTIDTVLNKSLRWKELNRHLNGIKTILDIGGGTGSFSIPLAKRGFEVTHIDLSNEMLQIAKRKAKGIKNIKFFQGNAINLKQFQDLSFDLVLNMDGAISFCGSDAVKSIFEACRLTRKIAVLTVSNRAYLAASLLQFSIIQLGSITQSAIDMLDSGFWHQDSHPENKLLTKGFTQDYLGPVKAFTITEMLDILR